MPKNQRIINIPRSFVSLRSLRMVGLVNGKYLTGVGRYISFLFVGDGFPVPNRCMSASHSKRGGKPASYDMIIRSQQPDACLGAGFHGLVIPDAGLDFTDMGAAHHQHTKAALSDTAADGQGQFVV